MWSSWTLLVFCLALNLFLPCAICEEIPTDEDKNLLGAVDPETINELNQIRLDIGKHQPKPVEKTKEMSQEIDDMKGLLMQSNIRADSNLGKKMAQLVSSEAKVSDQILKNAIVKELNDKNDTDIEIEVPELQPELLSSINIIDSHIYNDIEEQDKPSAFKDRFPLNKKTHNLNQFTSAQDANKNIYREKLQIESVQENTKFKSGESVLQWKTIIHGEKTTVVGRRTSSLVLLQEHEADSFEEVQVLAYSKNESFPRTLESFKVWDDATEKMLNILVVASDHNLLWYQLNNQSLELIWNITLHSKVLSTMQFNMNQKNILLLTTTDGQARFYQFELPTQQFWMTQMIHLEVPTSSMTSLEAGQDFVVAFVQNSSVSVYKYQNLHFEHLTEIQAANVTAISGFRIGGNSYLAVGGDEPKILRFLMGQLVLQSIFSETFGFIEAFLPIMARTYRDDLILLVQHRVQYPTHSTSMLEALIWNGLAFDSANMVTCHTADLSEPFGLNCLLDYEREEGLSGATFIKSGQNISLLVPRHEAQSGLYMINFKIVQTEDPIEKELEELQKSYDMIIEMMEYEDEVLSAAEAALQNTMNPYENQYFEDILKITEIDTEFLELENVQLEYDVIEFLNLTWTKFDSLVDLDKLEETLNEDEKILDSMEAQMNVLIRKNRESILPNSKVTILGNPLINGQLNPQSAQKINRPSHRKPRQLEIPKIVELRRLDVKNLFFESVNGVPADELVFVKNGTISFPLENLIVTNLKAKNVELSNDGTVNGMDVGKNAVTMEAGNFPANLNIPDIVVARNFETKEINNFIVEQQNIIPNEIFEDGVELLPNITSNTIRITGNLKAERINGVPWKEFVLKTVRKNVAQTLDFIEVNGNLVIENEAHLFIEKLNGLQFPNEYVLKSGPSATIISGQKEFLGSLIANAVDTDGNVNDLWTLELVTLDDNQTISQETLFYDLEVTERLEVKGTVFGKDLDQFMANPNLNQSNQIPAACMFRDLIVDGPIIIEETLNDRSLSEDLANVVYEGEAPVEITSVKTFKNVEFADDLRITSNFLNNINLGNVMLADQEQQVKITNLIGRVYFGKLNLGGTFNGVNITELDENAVKTFGDQFTESELVFEKLDPSLPFATGQLVRIERTLNGIDVNDFVDHENNVKLNGNVYFEDLTVDSLRGKHISGPGSFDNLNLKEFEQTRLSKTKPNQQLFGPAHIGTLISEKNFESQYINGIEMKLLKTYVNNVRNYQDLLLAGNLTISNLVVEGNVLVTGVNGRNLRKMMSNAIWLNKVNTIRSNFKFLDPITLQKELIVHGFVNGKNFKTFVQNLVSIKEDPIKLKGTKVFLHDLKIEESLNVKRINEIDFVDIWKKKDEEVLEGLNLAGNLQVNSLIVENDFNGKSIKWLGNVYEYNAETNTHKINIDVSFKDQVNVNHLQLNLINEANVTAFLNSLVKVNQSDFLLTEKQFLKSVSFEKNLKARFFNGLDLAILNEILRVDEKAPVKIFGDVLFDGKISSTLIVVNRDLLSRFISGCDPAEWLINGIPINKDIIISHDMKAISSVFARCNITLNILNGHPMADLLTIATNQVFDKSLSLDELSVRSPLQLRGLLNGRNLEFEHSNTLMLYGDDQIVSARTTFQQSRVLNSLTANHRVNKRNLHQVAQLNSDLLIESPISFRSVNVENLLTKDQISGVQMESWHDRAVWANGRDQQTIYGKWTINKGLIKEDVHGNGLINGASIDEVQRGLELNIAKVNTVFDEYQKNYPELCHEMQYLTNISKHNVHVLKYFENSFILHADHKIYSLHSLHLKSQHFLLINTGCSSSLYSWQDGEFKKLQEIVTGFVDNWLSVPSHHNEVYVVTNTKLEKHGCEIGGTNVWKLSGQNLNFHANVGHEHELLELHNNYARKEERFYALMSDNKVEEFTVYGNKIEEWEMPAGQGYRFVPNEAGYGLAVCDGKMLFRLNSVQQQNQVELKKKRDLFPVPSTRTPLLTPDSKITKIKTLSEIKEEFKNKTAVGQQKLEKLFNKAKEETVANEIKNIPVLKGFPMLLRPQVAPTPKKVFDDSSAEQEEEEDVDFSSQEFLTKEEKRPLKKLTNKIKENLQAIFKTTKSIIKKLTTKSPALDEEVEKDHDGLEIVDEQTTISPIGKWIDKVGKLFKQSTQITDKPTEETAKELTTIEMTTTSTTEKAAITQRSDQEIVTEEVTDKPDPKNRVHSPENIIKTSTQSAEISEAETATEDIEVGHGMQWGDSYEKGSFRNINEHNIIFKALDVVKDNIEKYLLESPNPNNATNVTMQNVNETDFIASSQGSPTKQPTTQTIQSTQATEPTVKLNIPLTPRFIINEDSDEPELNSQVSSEPFDDFKTSENVMESSTVFVSKYPSTTEKSLKQSKATKIKTKGTTTRPTEKPTTESSPMLSGIHNVTSISPVINEVANQTTESSTKSSTTSSQSEETFTPSTKESLLHATESPKTTTNQPETSTTMKHETLDELLDEVMPGWRNAPEIVGNDNPEQTTELLEDLEDERIAQPIPVGGISAANSLYLPAVGSGEMVVLNVGPKKQRRTLVGVSSSRQSTIKGKHDVIQIYEDVLEGKLYQSLHCFQPSNLNALHFQDETLLVFLEGYIDVQVFIYRGIQGLVPYAQFKLSTYAQQMTSLQLPPTLPFKCDRRFLMITINSDVIFIETKIAGNCGMEENLHCDGF